MSVITCTRRWPEFLELWIARLSESAVLAITFMY